MSLNSINPTSTKAWSELTEHFKKIKDVHINDYFDQDNDRVNNFTISWGKFYFDFSKNKIDNKTLNLFNDFLAEINLKSSIEKYFNGERINSTEGRSVLHTALRSEDREITLDLSLIHI